MSLNRFRERLTSPNLTFRSAIQLVLATSLLTGCPADSETPRPTEKKNYDYLFEGIDTEPDEHIDDKPEPVDAESDDPLCTPQTCKPV